MEQSAMSGTKRGAFQLRWVAICAALFLVLDGAISFNPRWRSDVVNDLFILLAPLLALGACWWRGRQASERSRFLWILLQASLLIWTCGQFLSIWEVHFRHLRVDVSLLSDFAFFFYGVPILFAISTPVDGHRVSWFIWLDGIQAAFAGYLAYAAIFSALPFSGHVQNPLPDALLAYVYNTENIVLAVACGLRMFTSPRWSDEWRFYRMLGIFLIVYAIGSGLYNYYELLTPGQAHPDLFGTAPFIVLTVHALTLPWKRKPEQEELRRRHPAELFIDNASPIFFTLALFTLGLVVMRIQFIIGIIAISVALVIYAIRTTALQTLYLEAQRELKEARDRLEALSLEDGLTGVANRRGFDQTLAQEWHRAARTRQPLALIFADLDLFKELNDSHGHQAGDRCLIQVAGVLHGLAKRSGDLVARYGGEEFAAILAGANTEEALSMAERMRAAIVALHIANSTELGSWLTASIGVTSCIPTIDSSPEMILAAADRALYRAKAQGRNRVELEIMSTSASLMPASAAQPALNFSTTADKS
jgi:diguanylate cyclase (GGDEF)-like protein